MQEFVTYWIKVAAVLAVFYLFFKILLSRETYHRLNRAVLLTTAVLSFVLPLCVITIYRPITIEQFEVTYNTQFESAPVIEQIAEQSVTTEWWSIAFVVLLLGAVAVVVWSGHSILAIHRLMGSCKEVESTPEGKILVCREAVTPFSWFGNIVLSERDWEESGEIIIAHERAHIALHHSVDMLLVNLCCALQWFNPAMWLLRRDLREVHEYEADEQVLLSGVNAKEYQLLLIKKAVGNKSYSIANSLNHSTLKNRITMMLQKKSSRASRMRVLYVLPLVCLSLTAFAQTEPVIQTDDKVTEKISEKQPSRNEMKSAHITLQGRDILLNGKMIAISELADALKESGVSPQSVINITSEGEVKMAALTRVKDMLRKANYLRISYDNTTPRILPPSPENVGEGVELAVPFLRTRCLMNIVINDDNSLNIRFGGEEWRLKFDEKKIRHGVKTFVKNAKNSEMLPTKHSETFSLSDGRSVTYDVSDGTISLEVSNNANFDIFKKAIGAIYAAYEELREEAAKELFGRSLAKLTPEERDAIHKAIPIRVSETSTARLLTK